MIENENEDFLVTSNNEYTYINARWEKQVTLLDQTIGIASWYVYGEPNKTIAFPKLPEEVMSSVASELIAANFIPSELYVVKDNRVDHYEELLGSLLYTNNHESEVFFPFYSTNLSLDYTLYLAYTFSF